MVEVAERKRHAGLDDLGVKVFDAERREVGQVVDQRQLEALLVELAEAPVGIVDVRIERGDADAAVVEFGAVVALHLTGAIAVTDAGEPGGAAATEERGIQVVDPIGAGIGREVLILRIIRYFWLIFSLEERPAALLSP